MATKLDKELTRESSIKFDEREVLVTLTEDQRISFKLKGMKSGVLSVGIDELYGQLRGEMTPIKEVDEKVPHAKTGSMSIKRRGEGPDNSPMISLNALRTNNMVTHMDLKTKVVLEGLICELLKQEIKL